VSAGPRFVEVPADRLLGELREIGRRIVGAGGGAFEGVQGREIFFDYFPPGGRSVVRVYTSLARGAEQARDCGEDAVRLVVGALTVDGSFRPLEQSQKILRTAPKADADRVATFLERLRSHVREAYRRAKAVPACPACGRTMARRESKHGPFWGCAAYPECKGTRRVEA
jgi:hypothetical protein